MTRSLAQIEDQMVKALAPTNTPLDAWLELANTLIAKRKAQLTPAKGTRRGIDGQFYRSTLTTLMPSLVERPTRERHWLPRGVKKSTTG